MKHSILRQETGRFLIAGLSMVLGCDGESGAQTIDSASDAARPNGPGALQVTPSELGAGPPDAAAVGEGDWSCGDEPPRFVELAWADVLAADVPVEAAAGALPWVLTNLSAGASEYDLILTIDRGTLRTSSYVVDHVDADPGATVEGTVDITAFGLELDSMQFSGMAMLTAREADLGLTHVGEPRFFHRDPSGAFLVYSEAVLQASFGAGDFHGLHGGLEEEGVVTTRVVSAADVVRSDSDELEPELDPEPEEAG